MPQFSSLEPSIDPNNRATFLLDWEVTMKCNLDCSYCPTGVEFGSHDNSTVHPALAACLDSIDFMFAYVDLYMRHKSPPFRYVVLNVYGGESLHHPDIVEILKQVRSRHEPYQDRWSLTVTTTTNLIVPRKKLEQIHPLIDEWTVSYHAESRPRQKAQFRDNLSYLNSTGTRLKCVVMMHDRPHLFEDSREMVAWLDKQGIRSQPRQIDNRGNVLVHNQRQAGDRKVAIGTYDQQQLIWFDGLYKTRSYNADIEIKSSQPTMLSQVGRACCGGRQTCQDQNYAARNYFVNDNRFRGWQCSVNWFFLYVKQITGDVYHNKDCRMRFDGTIGAIGNVKQAATMLDELDRSLRQNSLPVITCDRDQCLCGLCAPKAADLPTYKKIMPKYVKDYAL